MYQFDNGIQAGAQIYAYTLDGVSDITLDWGGVSYQFSPEFGVSVGRNKIYNGLHNHTQNLDVVRTFASLPFGPYYKALRPITSAMDGVSIGGVLDFGSAGSFEYNVNVGFIPDVGEDAYIFVGSLNDETITEGWNIEGINFSVWGAWNTHVDGLRVGASFARVPDSNIPSRYAYTNELSGVDLATALEQGAFYANLLGIPGLTPAMAWDSVLAGNDAEFFGHEGDAYLNVPAFGIINQETPLFLRNHSMPRRFTSLLIN
ncbi:MAG: hypothetical protein ACPGN3_03055 [Opitutales bacterium]